MRKQHQSKGRRGHFPRWRVRSSTLNTAAIHGAVVVTFLQAPEYSVCPVCNRRFPIPQLEAHVNLCLASQQHREQVLARPSNAEGMSASAGLSAAYTPATEVACAAEPSHCLQARAVHLPKQMQLHLLWMPQLLAKSCQQTVAA